MPRYNTKDKTYFESLGRKAASRGWSLTWGSIILIPGNPPPYAMRAFALGYCNQRFSSSSWKS